MNYVYKGKKYAVLRLKIVNGVDWSEIPVTIFAVRTFMQLTRMTNPEVLFEIDVSAVL